VFSGFPAFWLSGRKLDLLSFFFGFHSINETPNLNELFSKPSGNKKVAPNLCFLVRDFKFWRLKNSNHTVTTPEACIDSLVKYAQFDVNDTNVTVLDLGCGSGTKSKAAKIL
jgi:hypothetical protein